MNFKNTDGVDIVYSLIEAIQKNKDVLSEVDGLIGDGDHGVNMNKGFTLCKAKLDKENKSLSQALSVLGRTLVMDIGGSMGPLYGMLFIGMSKVCNAEIIDAKVIGDMLTSGYNGVVEIGQAKVGDKTLIDVLAPAVETYNKSIENGETLVQALENMKKAAENGLESTIDMVAKIGRASRLGERSRGVPDAGATSCNILLQSFANSIIDKVN